MYPIKGIESIIAMLSLLNFILYPIKGIERFIGGITKDSQKKVSHKGN